MANLSTSGLWKVGGNRQLLWRSWDNESVVFDPLSGDTHVLNQIASQALKILEVDAVDAAKLSHRIADQLNLQDDEALLRHMERLLIKFEDLGLIEPQSP